jgi:hypothetical protein
MKNRILPFACSTALAVAFTVSRPGLAHAERVTPPPVPEGLEVPAGNRAYLVGHAVGSQDYVCLPSASGFAWTLFTPQATLFGQRGRQLITHFFSPNPFEGGTIRPAWQHSRDTSTVWARPRRAVQDHLHPPAEHRWRGCALDRLHRARQRRPDAVRPLPGRLLLLRGRRARRRRGRLAPPHEAEPDGTAVRSYFPRVERRRA